MINARWSRECGRFCRRDSPGGISGRAVDAEVPEDTLDRSLWRELGKCGFFSLRLAEKDGGAGLGLPEAVFLFEEAGRHLLPGPLVATHLAAGLIPGVARATRS